MTLETSIQEIETNLDNGFIETDHADQLLKELLARNLSAPLAEKTAALAALTSLRDKIRTAYTPGKEATREVISSRETAVLRMSELWDLMQNNFYALVNASQITEVTQAAKEMREISKFLTPSEQKLMEACFKLRDAAYDQGGEDASTFLAWSTSRPAAEARVKARILCDEDSQKLFLTTTVAFTDSSGVEHKIEMPSVFQKIEEYFNGPYSYDPSNPSLQHNYAAFGNPDKDQKEDGIPTIEELVQRDFPEFKFFPDIFLESIHNFIIVSEMRSKFYIWEYAGYQGSPIPGFDGSPAEDASPLAASLYKAQSGSAFPKHRIIAVVTRFPDPSDPRWGEYNANGGPQTYNFSAGKPDYIGTYHTSSFGMQESTVGRNKVPQNIKTWAAVRNRMIADMTAKSLGWVRLRPDLKLKPTWYDWLKGSWEGSSQPLGNFSYFNFLDTEQKFKIFEDFIDGNYQPPRNLDEVDTVVGELVDKIRDFKLLLPDAGKLKDDEELLLNVVQLMSIMYLKRVYSAFKSLRAVENKRLGRTRFTSRRGYKSDIEEFVEICGPIILDSGTLPKSVKEGGKFPLKDLIQSLEGSNVVSRYFGRNWASFFEDTSEKAEESSFLDEEKKKDTPFRRVYLNWMRGPREKEKTAGH